MSKCKRKVHVNVNDTLCSLELFRVHLYATVLRNEELQLYVCLVPGSPGCG